MRLRGFLIFTGIVSALLGALVVYLVLSVPNDLRADALLQQAHKDITAGQNDKARASLLKVVQQYPRTDAAAASTAALLSLAQKERDELARAVGVVRTQNTQQLKMITDLQKTVDAIKNAPPRVVTVQGPPAPMQVVKNAPPKKPAPKKPARRRR
jgi:predicted RND superfamily exporter protein